MTNIDGAKKETNVEQAQLAGNYTQFSLSMLTIIAVMAIVGVGIFFFVYTDGVFSTSQVSVALSVLFALLGTLAAAYFGIKSSGDATREIQSATKASDVFAQQLANTEPSNILEVAGAQTELLTSYYRTVLAQARESFRWALIVAGLGFLCFVGAAAFLLITQLPSIAAVGVISGALVEVIAGINFYLYGKTTAQLATFHNRLDQVQRFLLANSICEAIEGEELQKARSALVATIANPNT